jgi:ubiquitin-conjugating enzyme E2 R
MSAAQTLQRQFREFQKNQLPGFNVELKEDNIFVWDIGIFGPPDTIYEGGYFKATMKFPEDYPFNPPTFTFNSPFFHPNVYTDGRLCISILHPPTPDPMSGERPEERWNPTQSVESILISVISLLTDPNVSSPANVDAGVMYRNDREQYKIVREQVEKSKKDIPENVTIPKSAEDFIIKNQPEQEEDESFWYDDEVEEDWDDEDYMSDE